MAQKVKFKRKTTSEIDNLEIEDGALIYNVDNGKTYMDYGTQRIPTGGGANGGIYVGDTEPTDPDITLWVDTPTSETKASEIVDEYTESDKVGYSTSYANRTFMRGKKLWTNNNVQNTSAGTVINLSSTDYDLLLWEFVFNVANTYQQFSTIVEKENGVHAFGIGINSGTLVRRTLTYTDDSTYTVASGFSGSSTDDTVCIPVACYGIKLG